MTGPAHLPRLPDLRRTPRIDANAEDLGRGLGQLVVALLELVRDLLERQAIRRMDGGSLDDEEIERLGEALLELEDKFAELREIFGVEREGLRLPVDVDDLLDEHERLDTTGRHNSPWQL
ncbi:gas vesicle protein K [Actinopolymorpha sp. NPDC004070]|uniref:gas vesicle protein K n=1 Tax=Actinopolymorpha sp. NPDC004070 TaxID=3154548 RepID=UPI0033A79E9C